MSRLSALLGRETALAWGRGGGPLVSVGFYAGVATLLPLAIGPEPARLAAVAPGAAWTSTARMPGSGSTATTVGTNPTSCSVRAPVPAATSTTSVAAAGSSQATISGGVRGRKRWY